MISAPTTPNSLTSYEYRVGTSEFGQTPEAKASDYSETNTSTLSHTFSGLTSGVDVWITATAKNAVGESITSNPKKVTPA